MKPSVTEVELTNSNGHAPVCHSRDARLSFGRVYRLTESI